MSRLGLAIDYIYYYFSSVNKHGVHSPFVYKLVTEVINAPTPLSVKKPIENRRSSLKKSDVTIEFEDFGANPGAYTKRVSNIANRALKPPKYAQLIYRLVHHFQPKIAIELGTSLGITTLYQATAMQQGTLYTMEGSNEVLKIAQEGFKEMKPKATINSIAGNFDDTLPELLNQLSEVDYVYFDGNHRKAPTLAYFKQCLEKAHNNSFFIFDDINWSAEMKEAWEEIKNHPQVTVTIDLFFIGLVFFRQEQEKEHFKIRF